MERSLAHRLCIALLALTLGACVADARADGEAAPLSECTATWTEVRSPAPRPSRAQVACTEDWECSVVAAGECCGPCGTLTLPAERVRAVNEARNPGIRVGCSSRRVACPACAGRYEVEEGYAVACRAQRCQIVRGSVPEGCPAPVYPLTRRPRDARR